MDYPQPQRIFERVEVAVAMEEGMAIEDAEGRDQAVDGLTDCLTACSQLSIVASGGDGEIDATSLEKFELSKVTEHARRLRV